MDHLESKTRGRLGHTSGPEKLTSSVEVWSSVMPHLTTFMLNTKSLTANETIISKTKFERLTSQMECRFQVTTPTTVFQSRRIHEGTPPKGQGIKFSGVGAKWQNGVAENAVKIVTWKARALMIHASLHWPEEDPACGPCSILCCSPLQQHSQQRIRHCSSRNLHRHQVRLPGPPNSTPGMSHLCPSPNFAR
jgi:hypothetical protein